MTKKGSCHTILFEMDTHGKGMLSLLSDDVTRFIYKARSGSINKSGNLINCITMQPWYLYQMPEIPVPEEYEKMYKPEFDGFGWKARLNPYPTYPSHSDRSHILIHPDGGKPGTLGCIGILDSNANELFGFLMNHFGHSRGVIPLEVKWKAA